MNFTKLGTITLLSVTGSLLLSTSALAGTPSVDLVPDALDPQACNGQGCWTNHLRVTDIDGDGDLDILLANYGDFFQGNDNPQPLVVYVNDGNAGFSDNSAEAVGNYAGNLRQIAVGDVDGDGSPDIYGPSGNGDAHVLFINDGSGVFVDEADARLPSDYPSGAAARMGDVDNDGDLDIFAADGYPSGSPYGHLYLNDGAGVFTEVDGAIPGSISGVAIDDVEFFDADRDFDLDLIVNAHSNGIGALWLNDGSGSFSAGGTLAPMADMHFHYNVAPCDVDGDGDLDLWIDNIGGNFGEQLQINDGSGNFSDETAARVLGNPGQDDNGVICVDFDDDGDFDGVVLSLGTPERLLENDGSGNFTYVAGVFPPPTDCTLWGEFGDLNGDHRTDLVTGQGECTFSNEVYLGNMQVPADSTPPKLLASEPLPAEIPAEGPTLRFAVSDRTVTDEGPRLNMAYALIDPDGAATVVPAKTMGGDLFRVTLPAPDALITFQLCAEDRAGNVTCSDSQSYGEDPGTTDTGTDTGTTGGDTGTDTDTGPDTLGTTDGTGGDEIGADEGALDDGCNCSSDGSKGGALGWTLLGLLGLGLGSRRRRVA